MAYYSEQQKAKDIGYLIGAVVGLPLGFFLCWIFNIEGGKEYGWFAGCWHGGWMVLNWIRSLFFDVYVKAPFHTTAYNVFWWIFAIWGCVTLGIMVLRLIGIIRKMTN